MKMSRALYIPAVLSLAVSLAGGLAWWGAGTPAHAAGTDTLVPLAGTVNGQPESVSFSGNARINSRLAPDPDFNRPQLVLTIDLGGVSGVGSSTRTKYVISAPEIVQRGLAPSHAVEITFPFAKSLTDGSLARSGLASFALNFDVNTGVVTSATGNIASPSFPN